MKILITGANGFLGSWLTKKLSEEGNEISILVRSIKNQDEFHKLGIKVFIGDVTQPESLFAALKGQQQVYHLAGLVAYSKDERDSLFRINAGGTENLIKAAIKENVNRVLLVSSVVAVGASFKPEVLSEESPYTLQKYHLSYYESKRKAEIILKDYVSRGLIDGVIVNPSTIYGAGDASKNSRSTQLKVARGELKFYSPGGVSVVAVEDVVNGMIKAMAIGRSAERYILSGENLTFKEVFNMIAECSGVPKVKFPLPPAVFKGLAFFDQALHLIGGKGPLPSERAIAAQMYHWYDSKKAQVELGFSARPAIEAISNSVQWMRDNSLLV